MKGVHRQASHFRSWNIKCYIFAWKITSLINQLSEQVADYSVNFDSFLRKMYEWTDAAAGELRNARRDFDTLETEPVDDTVMRDVRGGMHKELKKEQV